MIVALALLLSAPQDHAAMGHAPAPDPHAGHAMPAQDPHAGHRMPAMAQGTPPTPPRDHAADTVYDPAAMARARAAMTREHGGMPYSQAMLDRLEYRAVRGRDGYAWEGEAWVGGDVNRFAISTEGEGEAGGAVEDAEVQALYRRAIGPWFNAEAGVRQDIGRAARTHLAIGIDGLAPYWFDVSAQAFLSTHGEVQARLEASYDQRITQRLILQPRAEFNLAAQDVPDSGIGAGLSDAEFDLRLRYEFVREFAPYVGISYSAKTGRSANFARAVGEDPTTLNLVFGVRAWF